MEPSLHNINIGKGLGQLKFGMTRDKVMEHIGEPEDTEKFAFKEEDDELSESWHYDSKGFSLVFDEVTDWNLITISVSSPDFKLKGNQLIGLQREDVMGMIKSMELGSMEEEDYSVSEDHDHRVIAIEESNINFWFENGKLREIQWGPLLN